MRRSHLLLPLACVLIVGLAGAQNGEEPPPPDGTPDLSGAWLGKLRVKYWDQHDHKDDKGRGATGVQIDVEQEGSDIQVTLWVPVSGGSRQFVMQGKIGNGQFWALMEEKRVVFLLTGHVKNDRWKGLLVFTDDYNVGQAKLKAKRGEETSQVPVQDTPSGNADGDPSIAGTWSGKHKYKAWTQYARSEGEKGKGKDEISLEITQLAHTIDVDYTVQGDDGPETIPLVGEHGNGHFWAKGTHPTGGPMMVIGHAKKGAIKGVGNAAFDSAVWEFKFKVKPPQ
jgi:hypothetical protein